MTHDSLMMTLPAESYEEWHRQKSRHLTTATYYRFPNRFKFVIEAVSRQLLWLAAISSAIFHNFALIACSALIIKLLIQTSILSGAAKKLNEGKIYWSTFIFDFLLPIILIIFHIENLFRTKQVKWK
jgi:poly-beta-1,6-N-acetyl-D-glucosamine synthase